MRRFIIAAVAAATMAGTALLSPSRAEATMLAMPGAAVGVQDGVIQDVRMVCRRTWNGAFWERRCWNTGPRYYGRGYYDGYRRDWNRPQPWDRPLYQRPRYYGMPGYY